MQNGNQGGVPKCQHFISVTASTEDLPAGESCLLLSLAATGAPLQPNTAQGSERPEKEPVDPFQRRTGGSPGHTLFGRRPRGPQLSAFGPAAMRRQPGEGAGEKGGRLRRSAELPQPRSRAGNTAHRGCRSWRSFSRTEGLSAGPRFVLAQAPGSERSGAPVGHLPKAKATRTSRSKQAAG